MKRIIELSENDYKLLKEHGVQNYIALADTIIAHSVPYDERPQGEWIKDGIGGIGSYRCSLCGRVICTSITNNKPYEDYPFCHCGADMRGNNEK